MVNLMKDKIPFYNIVNMFFVGATFLLANALLFHNYILLLKTDNQLYAVLKEWSVVTSAAIIIAIYELGFVLNRVSSVLIAPILEKTKIWPKEEYDIDVSELTKAHPKAQSMITDLVLMRTHILMYFILAIEALFSIHKIVSLVSILLIVLFVFFFDVIKVELISSVCFC